MEYIYEEILNKIDPQGRKVLWYLLSCFMKCSNRSIEYLHKIKEKYPKITKIGYKGDIPEDILEYVIKYNIECFNIETIIDIIGSKYKEIADIFIKPIKIHIPK